MIGTGPFMLLEWRKGERIAMARNDHYRDRKPAWKEVVLRPIPNEAARVAALLAHDIGAINAVPPSAIPDLKNRSDLRVLETASAADLSGFRHLQRIVPLFHAAAVWGLRKGLTYVPRKDTYTLSQDILPAP